MFLYTVHWLCRGYSVSVYASVIWLISLLAFISSLPCSFTFFGHLYIIVHFKNVSCSLLFWLRKQLCIPFTLCGSHLFACTILAPSMKSFYYGFSSFHRNRTTHCYNIDNIVLHQGTVHDCDSIFSNNLQRVDQILYIRLILQYSTFSSYTCTNAETESIIYLVRKVYRITRIL